MHRDIKSMNILVTDDYSCKLTDFGCVKLVNAQTHLNTVNSGTPLWMAPEVKIGQYSFPADVYSLGLVLYEIFEKKLPNYDPMQQRVVLPPAFHSASVILPMVSHKPDSRPTAQHTITVLDKMVNNIVETIRKKMPKEELEKLRTDAGTTDDSQSSVDKELALLYRQLLAKPAAIVDSEINKHFPTPAPPKSPHVPHVHGQHGGAPMGYPPGYPGMGVPMGIPVAPRAHGQSPQGWPPGFSPAGY